jgi:glycosyltransferase involved in cell wall biosynthesis
MSGGYTLHDVDLFAPGAEAPALRPAPGAEGMGCILRDGTSVIDFRLFAAREIPAGGLSRGDLLRAEGRAASAHARLRARLVAAEPPAPRAISVAICTKDRPDWLRRLLASLAAQETDKTFEIVVVDNNSDSPEVRAVAEAAGAVYVRERRTGLDFARNAALEAAGGEVVAYLDDDTIAEPQWFENLHRAWAENPDAGCVTGQVLPMFLETEAQILFEKDGGFRRAFLPQRYGTRFWGKPLHPCGPGEFGAGANMSVERAYVLALGGFDEALDTGRPLPGGGDLDIFYRTLRGGRPLVYDPSVVVRHEHRREVAALRHQYYTWGTGFFAFLEKSRRTDPANATQLRQMEHWYWLNMVGRLARSLAGRDGRPPRLIAAEMQGALKGRFGEYDRSRERSRRIREAAS